MPTIYLAVTPGTDWRPIATELERKGWSIAVNVSPVADVSIAHALRADAVFMAGRWRQNDECRALGAMLKNHTKRVWERIEGVPTAEFYEKYLKDVSYVKPVA